MLSYFFGCNGFERCLRKVSGTIYDKFLVNDSKINKSILKRRQDKFPVNSCLQTSFNVA